MCVYVCVQNLPFQIIPPSFFSLSPSLSLSLSLSLCLRPSASQSSREKEKKEKNLKQIHVTCQPVHGCISNMSRMANILFFSCTRRPTRVFFCLLLSFFPPPPYAAPGGWMAGAKSKQVWRVAQRRKAGAPAGRLALPTSATPALLCEPAARGCCVTVVRRRLS